jgi:micrococcal nuclease
MEVKDPDKRKIFQSQAAKFNWSTRELEEAVKADKLPGDNNLEQEDSQTTNFSGKLTPGRGKLYAYKILPADYLISGPDKAVVDLGFYICTEIALSGQPRLKDEEIVEVIKTDNSYQIEKSELVKNDIYIYKALIDHIIDGDTVCVKIDCGLNIWVRQVLRLRGIDTPELSTPRGQKAKLFLEKALDEVPFIIVKTYKADKYDRYLTDLFYLKSTVPQKILERGTYLNQQLLDLGLAKII